jgi:hypothetical protein
VSGRAKPTKESNDSTGAKPPVQNSILRHRRVSAAVLLLLVTPLAGCVDLSGVRTNQIAERQCGGPDGRGFGQAFDECMADATANDEDLARQHLIYVQKANIDEAAASNQASPQQTRLGAAVIGEQQAEVDTQIQQHNVNVMVGVLGVALGIAGILAH